MEEIYDDTVAYNQLDIHLRIMLLNKIMAQIIVSLYRSSASLLGIFY